MISKANIVDGALQHLAIDGLLMQPMAQDQNAAIQHLDDMAAAYAGLGLDVGYLQPEQYGTSTGSDDSGVDISLVGPLKIILSGYIASQFGKQYDPGKLQFASDMLSAQLVKVNGTKYPVTMPFGSGNYDGYNFGENYYRGGLPI